MTNPLPKLRPIEIQRIVHGGRPALLLHDPLGLTERNLIVPQALGPALALLDGAHDLAAWGADLAERFRVTAPDDLLRSLAAALDENCMLESERFVEAHERARATYRAAPFRPPALVGGAYPADPADLRHMLGRYVAGARTRGAAPLPATAGRGLISPHIDYARGGPVYAAVWSQAAEAARAADLVVIFGTDHHGGPGRLTLTPQNYATPFGVLPTAQGVVDALAASLGEEAAYAAELHHRAEHSIELAAVWLHYVREGRPVELVPILCGSFAHFVQSGADPAADAGIAALLAALSAATAGRRVFIVAAADLAHIGPAFDGEPATVTGRARLQASDEGLIGHVAAGDAASFCAAIQAVGDRDNICGLPPIYLALRALAPVRGQLVAYDRCPADDHNTSWVSVCGVTF